MDKANRSALWAYILPFGIFMAGLAVVPLVEWVKKAGGFPDSLFFTHPQFWIYPLQTLACAIVLGIFWKRYTFNFSKGAVLGVVAGLVVLLIWISPQLIFGAKPRIDGFNPDLLATQPFYYWSSVVMRFVRLVLVVAFVEEIFWRGFLMRFLIKDDFEKVPFGQYQLFAFAVVAGLFALEHSSADWVVAAITGVIYNGLAVKTKSLGACVIAHGVTNFGLGLYIMATKQWGFW